MALVLDDYDSCNIFNKLLATGREVCIPENSKLIKSSVSFRIFVTGNTDR